MAENTPLPFEPEEAWLPVIGYEGVYEVSDHGRVRRVAGMSNGRRNPIAGRIRRLTKNEQGYLFISLHWAGKPRTFLVHGLVLRAFVGPPPAGHECNHKDGNKANNHLSNLEWVTPRENGQHALRTGLRNFPKGERHGMAKLTAEQVAEIRALFGIESHRHIAARFGVAPSTISNIRHGKRWKG